MTEERLKAINELATRGFFDKRDYENIMMENEISWTDIIQECTEEIRRSWHSIEVMAEYQRQLKNQLNMPLDKT